MGKKTIYDVAKEAGVSISTVSRALNGTAKVKESTRRRIEAACVGYVPNAQARELQTHNVKTVGVIINHTPEYFFMNDTYVNALLGISVVARDKGYQLILNITDDEDVCDLYLENRVAGFIVMGVKKDGWSRASRRTTSRSSWWAAAPTRVSRRSTSTTAVRCTWRRNI